MTIRVAIGPRIDLHCGIHGSLFETPISSIEYAVHDAWHTFVVPPRIQQFSPFTDRHVGEMVDLGAGNADVVHTARWPALGAHTWVTDMDDLGYPLLAGRTALSSDFRREFRSEHPPEFRLYLKNRTDVMLAAYAHPSCKAVLMRTRYALRRATELLAATGKTGEAFLRKCTVIGPAVSTVPASLVETKWERCSHEFRVVFCGRDWKIKQGGLALRVMRRLAVRYPTARFTYIGAMPDTASTQEDVLQNLQMFGELPREQVLEEFARSHVFFHPARVESFGMVLIEAAAAGMAIVCAKGPGMEHVEEVINDRGAILLDREQIDPVDEEQIFDAFLTELLNNRSLARALGTANYSYIINSPFLPSRRNNMLFDCYRTALSEPSMDVLDVTRLASMISHEPVCLASNEVIMHERRFRERTGFRDLNIQF